VCDSIFSRFQKLHFAYTSDSSLLSLGFFNDSYLPIAAIQRGRYLFSTIMLEQLVLVPQHLIINTNAIIYLCAEAFLSTNPGYVSKRSINNVYLDLTKPHLYCGNYTKVAASREDFR
jgi:hypothetical protein